MTVSSHSTDHYTAPIEARMYPALRVMERQCPPLKYGRPPYWRAPVCPASDRVYIPTWNWQSPADFPDGAEVVVLDVIAAYMAAMGSAKIAHSHLIATGGMDHPNPNDVAPGYYRVTIPYWAFSGSIVHPLGNSTRVETEQDMWITAPTLILLLELVRDGFLGGFEILDSYTAEVSSNFLSWSARLRSLRNECLDRLDMAQTELRRRDELARYDAFKTGYSAALSMMLTGEKCLTKRPDWTHTIHAAHAANTWRKAWRYTFSHPLVAMGATDEIAVLAADVHPALARPKPPFRYDPTGRWPGALRVKTTTTIGAEPPQRADAVPMVDESEGIL